MKVLIFIPTLTAGGAERVASILANKWCDYPETSVTVLLMFEDEIFFPVDSRVKIHQIGLKPNLSVIKRTWALMWALFVFRRIVKRERPDFVLSFMNKYNVFCLASLFNSGIATIASERDSPTEPGMQLRLWLRKLLYPRADGIITQTQESKRYIIEKIGHKNITVIYNPIAASEVHHFSNREKLVLNVGRLVPKKGQMDLLHAFARADVFGWDLVICGDGPLRSDLYALASKLGIQDRVRFTGTIKEVNTWLARAGVFAFPSYFEGFPNALAEAMVAGVPTVSYDCPNGPSELITHEVNGYLVEVGDIEGLANHLRDLMTDSAKAAQFSRNAIKVADKLDATMIAKQYFGFCVSAATQKNG